MRLMQPLSAAAAALARYDQLLRGMHNSALMLGPMSRQEAVVSSRIEGTVGTLDEVLRIEADHRATDLIDDGTASGDAVEVFLYARAMGQIEQALREGQKLSPFLLRAAHRTLLSHGRGASLGPGEFKTEQNYLADPVRRRVLFVPISPVALPQGLDALFRYMDDPGSERLIRTGVAHLEFEALHPFKDGNGRIGRMLIPLMLWQTGAIASPDFYISTYFEENKAEYIDRMRAVSADDDWTSWIVFFLAAVEAQSARNSAVIESVGRLYAEFKDRFAGLLASRWATAVLDMLFTQPVFHTAMLTQHHGISQPTALRFVRQLVTAGLVETIVPRQGSRPGLYTLEPLLALIRD